MWAFDVGTWTISGWCRQLAYFFMASSSQPRQVMPFLISMLINLLLCFPNQRCAIGEKFSHQKMMFCTQHKRERTLPQESWSCATASHQPMMAPIQTWTWIVPFIMNMLAHSHDWCELLCSRVANIGWCVLHLKCCYVVGNPQTTCKTPASTRQTCASELWNLQVKAMESLQVIKGYHKGYF